MLTQSPLSETETTGHGGQVARGEGPHVPLVLLPPPLPSAGVGDGDGGGGGRGAGVGAGSGGAAGLESKPRYSPCSSHDLLPGCHLSITDNIHITLTF